MGEKVWRRRVRRPTRNSSKTYYRGDRRSELALLIISERLRRYRSGLYFNCITTRISHKRHKKHKINFVPSVPIVATAFCHYFTFTQVARTVRHFRLREKVDFRSRTELWSHAPASIHIASLLDANSLLSKRQ